MYAALPLFPSFIMLTSVTVPGISLLPVSYSIALLAAVAALAVYASLLLAFPPHAEQPLLLPLLLWLGAAVLSGALGFDPRAGVLFDVIFGFGILWHCALVRFYGAPGVARAIFFAYLASGTLAAGAAVVMVATRFPRAVVCDRSRAGDRNVRVAGGTGRILDRVLAARVCGRARRAGTLAAGFGGRRDRRRHDRVRVDVFARGVDGLSRDGGVLHRGSRSRRPLRLDGGSGDCRGRRVGGRGRL